ncbi:MAG: DNA repair protein RecO [Planctomycetia bacterium]|nr:DNA repair protein RecO [Planctomycetia bacterium]
MATEKVKALVLRTTDWSETSRIATLFSRERGKLRGLAKGGRRLKSSFDNGLDLLTLCDMVLIRKTTGGLDLLTEAVVVRRFPRLHRELSALYAGYYVAELLADWTEELDPHPALFDEALEALEDLGDGSVGQRVLRFETRLLAELGYAPVIDWCSSCEGPLSAQALAFCAEAGGVLCPRCQAGPGERRRLSTEALGGMRALASEKWREPLADRVRAELRGVMGGIITHIRGKPPKLLPYLGG